MNNEGTKSKKIGKKNNPKENKEQLMNKEY
jgi:hypothetical protein